MVKKSIQHYSKERIKELHGFTKILFNRPILKFIIFVIIQLILIKTASYFPENYNIRGIIDFIGILISVYFILVIFYLVKIWINKLFNPKNIISLILAYALFIIGIILLFSTLYSIAEITKMGYIRYQGCSDKFDPSVIGNDPAISRDFFYFSSITFFTVGYGDICPMGFAKILAILNAFVGHLVAVVVVALIINNYFRKKEIEKNK